MHISHRRNSNVGHLCLLIWSCSRAWVWFALGQITWLDFFLDVFPKCKANVLGLISSNTIWIISSISSTLNDIVIVIASLIAEKKWHLKYLWHWDHISIFELVSVLLNYTEHNVILSIFLCDLPTKLTISSQVRVMYSCSTTDINFVYLLEWIQTTDTCLGKHMIQSSTGEIKENN